MITRIAFLAAFLGCAGLAHADLIHLKHGRAVEGVILKRVGNTVHVRTKDGGRLTLAAKQIRRVESRASAAADYAAQVALTDMTSPVAIERLALWASGRGMGEKATLLLGMARGLRLERMIARASARQSPGAMVDAFHWARSVGLEDAVLFWILRQASHLDPRDSAVRGAYALFHKDLDERKAQARRLAELASRPHYTMPVPKGAEGGGGGASTTRLKPKRTAAQRAEDGSWVERMRQARLREAEFKAGVLAREEAAEAEDAEAEQPTKKGKISISPSR